VLGIVAVATVTAMVVTMLFFGWVLVLACGIKVARAILVGRGILPSSPGRDPVRC
jgi:hypothetical protein